jgi:hypothetical protein
LPPALRPGSPAESAANAFALINAEHKIESVNTLALIVMVLFLNGLVSYNFVIASTAKQSYLELKSVSERLPRRWRFSQ